MDNTNYINILSGTSFVLAVISSFITVFNLINNYFKQRKTLDEINVKLFQEALASADIKKLGNYLDQNIGKVSISEFSTNRKIQNRVNYFVQSIISFLGTEDEIKKMEVQPQHIGTVYSEIPKELYPIIKELQFGQAWNALAQLRRLIEIRLREILTSSNISVKEFLPLLQVLSILNSMNLISTSTISDLKYVISVCNKAVHGVDVSFQEAEEAIQLAGKALNELIANQRGD